MLKTVLEGKQHYNIAPGAIIRFDVYDQGGKLVCKKEVKTLEDITVYLESTEIIVQEIK